MLFLFQPQACRGETASIYIYIMYILSGSKTRDVMVLERNLSPVLDSCGNFWHWRREYIYGEFYVKENPLKVLWNNSPQNVYIVHEGRLKSFKKNMDICYHLSQVLSFHRTHRSLIWRLWLLSSRCDKSMWTSQHQPLTFFNTHRKTISLKFQDFN